MRTVRRVKLCECVDECTGVTNQSTLSRRDGREDGCAEDAASEKKYSCSNAPAVVSNAAGGCSVTETNEKGEIKCVPAWYGGRSKLPEIPPARWVSINVASTQATVTRYMVDLTQLAPSMSEGA